MQYVSQYGQDKWVYELLGMNSYFLDVGSYDPINYSNTYVLEKEYGWTGICVEAQKDECDKYAESRDCIIVNALVDSEVYESAFLEYRGLSGIITNFSEYDKKRLLPKLEGRTLEESSVKITTSLLPDILKRYEVPKVIDYFSLDIEGTELRVLRAFPWDEYHVNVMTIEHNRLDTYYNEIRSFMSDLNFDVYPNHLSDNEDCFVNRERKYNI